MVKIYNQKFDCLIKNKYIDLFKSSSMSSYQSWSVVKSVDNFIYNFYNLKNVYYTVVEDNNDVVLIAPYRKNKNEISILGTLSGFDIVDCVHNIDDVDYLTNIYEALFKFWKCKGIDFVKWYFLPICSKSYEAIKKLNCFKSEETAENVSIEIPNGYTYEDMFKSLRKSVRQNIRTAYNRLNKKGLDINYKSYCNTKIDRLMVKKFNNLYIDRQVKKYEASLLKKKISIKYLNYVSKTINIKNNFVSYISIGNDIGAFMQGYVDDKNKQFIIPRLAINSEYEFYSPGMILVNETIKYICINHPGYALNLVRGDEKYKIDMGGKLYYTQKIIIQL